MAPVSRGPVSRGQIAACRRLTKAERVRRLEGYRWSSSYPGYVAKRNAAEGAGRPVRHPVRPRPFAGSHPHRPRRAYCKRA